MLVRGENIDVDEYGATISGDTLLILFNADHAFNIQFTLPRIAKKSYWQLVFDTYVPEWDERKAWGRSKVYPLRACSMAVFRRHAADQTVEKPVKKKKA
jgi:hypothetical protein